MVERIYGDIPNIKSDLEEKLDKYKPYMLYYNSNYKSILPKNSLVLDDTSDIGINDLSKINNLSNTIEFLHLINYKVKTPVIKWPKNLVAIILDYDSSDWMLVINQLPITLKFIRILNFDNKISNYTINWPPNLEVVYVKGCIVSNETISTLPVSVKLLDIYIYYLDIDITVKYDTYFDNLPLQLEILKIDLRDHILAKYFTSINNLPDSIQYLSLVYFDYNILKFPSNLKYLELYDKNTLNYGIIENIKKHKKPDEIVVDSISFEVFCKPKYYW